MLLMNIVNAAKKCLFFQCEKYGISFWQCPQSLFLVMGIVIIVSSLAVYAIGTKLIEDPLVVALIVLFMGFVLIIISFIITQSFERLAEASRMKTEFVSIVSHQLRSPISNLNWAIELLMSGRLGSIDEKQTEYFRILKENSARMQELAADLLIVSRIETGNLLFKKIEFSFIDLIEKLVKEFQIFAKASNVEIISEAPDDFSLALGDPSKIRLVVENLLENAIRYIKENGKVGIIVKKRKNFLYCEISDNGVGIPKNDQKYIFQKFFRSENVLRYQTQGSGLGLYIAKSVIEKSGGKIGFKSEENKGSTFWFTLPIK